MKKFLSKTFIYILITNSSLLLLSLFIVKAPELIEYFAPHSSDYLDALHGLSSLALVIVFGVLCLFFVVIEYILLSIGLYKSTTHWLKTEENGLWILFFLSAIFVLFFYFQLFEN